MDWQQAFEIGLLVGAVVGGAFGWLWGRSALAAAPAAPAPGSAGVEEATEAQIDAAIQLLSNAPQIGRPFLKELFGEDVIEQISAPLEAELAALRQSLAEREKALQESLKEREPREAKYAWLRSESIIRGAFKDGRDIDKAYNARRALAQHHQGET
jgi:hypothetical protein